MKGIPFKDVWTDISSIQGKEKLDYATQKPIKLLERLLDLYTNKTDLCLDIFAGSGTLGRACLNKNRNFVLIDINPKGKIVFEESEEQERLAKMIEKVTDGAFDSIAVDRTFIDPYHKKSIKTLIRYSHISLSLFFS